MKSRLLALASLAITLTVGLLIVRICDTGQIESTAQAKMAAMPFVSHSQTVYTLVGRMTTSTTNTTLGYVLQREGNMVYVESAFVSDAEPRDGYARTGFYAKTTEGVFLAITKPVEK